MRWQKHDPFVIFEVCQQLDDSNAKAGVRHVGSKFGKRYENETAVSEFWMWDLESAGCDGLALEQEDIKVDFARCPFLRLWRLFSSHRLFNRLKAREELVWQELGFDFDDTVDVPVFGVTVRLALIQRGALDNPSFRQRGDQLQCFLVVRAAVS